MIMLDHFNLYKVYLDFMYYTYAILMKYPKVERFSLVQEMRNSLYRGMRNIISYPTTHDLKVLSVELELFLVYVRISYRLKYISANNYKAFARKILKLEKMVSKL